MTVRSRTWGTNRRLPARVESAAFDTDALASVRPTVLERLAGAEPLYVARPTAVYLRRNSPVICSSDRVLVAVRVLAALRPAPSLSGLPSLLRDACRVTSESPPLRRAGDLVAAGAAARKDYRNITRPGGHERSGRLSGLLALVASSARLDAAVATPVHANGPSRAVISSQLWPLNRVRDLDGDHLEAVFGWVQLVGPVTLVSQRPTEVNVADVLEALRMGQLT